VVGEKQGRRCLRRLAERTSACSRGAVEQSIWARGHEEEQAGRGKGGSGWALSHGWEAPWLDQGGPMEVGESFEEELSTGEEQAPGSRRV
jgi:hypothetical protein